MDKSLDALLADILGDLSDDLLDDMLGDPTDDPLDSIPDYPPRDSSHETLDDILKEVLGEIGLVSMPEAFPERAPQNSPVWRELLFLFVRITSIALAFVLLFTFLFGIIRYQEPSMAPAVKDGDLVIFYRHNSEYWPRDAVVLKFGGKLQVRRIVATGSDTVDITEDGLVVNGAPQQELEIYHKTERYQDGVEFPLTVPEGHIFVLGDSRINAADSRVYGCVRLEDTLGKVMAVIRRRNV